ncbi:hypothetical protein FACS189438_1940 [Bacteroidia bacterium]|nr:hypothetical protein FACS189438_1940 [Bacteroidia bacterium]
MWNLLFPLYYGFLWKEINPQAYQFAADFIKHNVAFPDSSFHVPLERGIFIERRYDRLHRALELALNHLKTGAGIRGR